MGQEASHFSVGVPCTFVDLVFKKWRKTVLFNKIPVRLGVAGGEPTKIPVTNVRHVTSTQG